MKKEWISEIKDKFGGDCLPGEPLAPFTTYKIGGKADVLLFPADAGQWKWLTGFCRNENIPLTVFGGGSNILVSDSGLRGIAACTRRMEKIEISGKRIRARSGALLDEVIASAVKAGLGGMERLSGIPGSVGGAVRMNAGAFEQETFDRLLRFEAVSLAGDTRIFSKSDIKYGYRHADGLEGYVILSAEWELEEKNAAELSTVRSEILKTRSDKQPLEYPSAGSVFKRPKRDYASRLIDASGLKGAQVGDARVSTKHAGFIVNAGHATAKDVYELIKLVKTEVKKKTGVELELEQILLGKF